MGRVSQSGRMLQSVIGKIESVRLDGGTGGFVDELREILGVDALIYARLIERTSGWGLENFESAGVANPTRMRRALTEHLGSTSQPTPWLDLRRPPPDQCNHPIDVQAVVGHTKYKESTLHQKVFASTELAEHRVVRLLLCDGPNVVGWLGGFSSRAVPSDQIRTLGHVAAPLRERVRIERLLGSAPRIHAALEATLQQIGAPALLLDARNRIHEMNRAARELLTTKRDEVFDSIAAVRARKTPSLPFTVTRVSATGYPEQYLAVLRPRSTEARMSLSVTLAANRWKLTPRQATVLNLLVRGDSNGEIARALGISHRAAELHVTAIFDRAGVESRSQLVAAVLLG